MHKNLAFSLTLIATAACATPALADLTVVSHGGANKAAQVAAFYAAVRGHPALQPGRPACPVGRTACPAGRPSRSAGGTICCQVDLP